MKATLPRWVRRDHVAGLLVVALGLGVTVRARSYEMGTLANVGPGFMPLVFGVLLMVIGTAIAFSSKPSGEAQAGAIHAGPSLRGWCCIVLSVLLFVGLAQYAGLAPATFACVLVAALGDRNARLGSTLLLATGMMVFGVAVFHYGLGVQMPVIRGLTP